MIATPSPPSKIGVVILAAGKSSRMNGQPKQLLAFENQTLLRRAAETAIAANFEKIIVVLSSENEKWKNEIEDLPIVSAINQNAELGISSSIKTGLSAINAKIFDAVLIMLCDQPLITTQILQKIVGTFNHTGKPIVACQYEQTFGVPALFARELFDELTNLSADEGAKKIIVKNQDKAEFLHVPEAGLDIDTIEDYRKLLAQKIPADNF